MNSSSVHPVDKVRWPNTMAQTALGICAQWPVVNNSSWPIKNITARDNSLEVRHLKRNNAQSVVAADDHAVMELLPN